MFVVAFKRGGSVNFEVLAVSEVLFVLWKLLMRQ